MDLGLFAGVLWRSRFLVLVGLLAACAGAVFALARVEVVHGHPRLVYRSPVLYQSNVQLLVTQPGFPDGRSVFDTSPTTLPSGHVNLPKFADPSRFTGLALVYSQLIMGNVSQQRVFGTVKKPRNEAFLASPLPSPGGIGGFLPIIQITGIAASPLKAMALADRVATSFTSYLVQRQKGTGVAQSDRVILDRIAGPLKPAVYAPRKKLRGISVFVVLLMLTIAAAFIRENIRNRRAVVAEESAPAVELPLIGQAQRSGSSSSTHGTALAHEP